MGGIFTFDFWDKARKETWYWDSIEAYRDCLNSDEERASYRSFESSEPGSSWPEWVIAEFDKCDAVRLTNQLKVEDV